MHISHGHILHVQKSFIVLASQVNLDSSVMIPSQTFYHQPLSSLNEFKKTWAENGTMELFSRRR